MSEVNVARWQARMRTLPRISFVKQHPQPFLVCFDWGKATAAPGESDEEITERVLFSTQVMDLDALNVEAPPELSRALIAPLIKGDRNPYDFISLGRAQNCDVVLPDSSVSKLHATFKVLGPGLAEVSDAGSKNGTLVNGDRLERGKSLRARSGDKIVVGRIPLKLLDPAALYDLFQRGG